MEVRILEPNGSISQHVYVVVGDPDRRGRVLVSLAGQEIWVHQQRLLPVDMPPNSAVAIKGSKLMGICPTCKIVLEVRDSSISCSEHGTFPVVTNELNLPLLNMTHETTPTATKPAKTVIDPPRLEVDALREFCHAIYRKDNVKFDHPNVDVKAFVLLQIEPLRKISFNTYNGVLGKRQKNSPVEVLKLEAFRDYNSESPVGRPCSETLEQIVSKLIKDGYTEV